MKKSLFLVSAALALSGVAIAASDDYSTWYHYMTNKTDQTDIFTTAAFYDPADSTKTLVKAEAGKKYYAAPGFGKVSSKTPAGTWTFPGDVLALDDDAWFNNGQGSATFTFPELRLLNRGGIAFGSTYKIKGKVVACGTTDKPSKVRTFLWGTAVLSVAADFESAQGTGLQAYISSCSLSLDKAYTRRSILASHFDFTGNFEKFLGTFYVSTNTYVCRSGTVPDIPGRVWVMSGGYFGSSLTSGTITLGGLVLKPSTEMVFQFGSALSHPIYSITNSFSASGMFRVTCTNTVQSGMLYWGQDVVLARYTGADAKFSCDLSQAKCSFDMTITHPKGAHLEWKDNAQLGCKELVAVPEKPYIIANLAKRTGWQEAFRVKKSAGTITADDLLFSGYENVQGQCRYRVQITEEGDDQIVSVEDLNPGVFGASSGYIGQKMNDSDNESTWFTATLGAGIGSTKTNYWSDLKWAHPDTNYYNSGCIRVNHSPIVFGGRSFTLKGYARTDGEDLTFNDLRLVGGSMLNNNESYRYDQTTGKSIGRFSVTTLRGTMTVLSTESNCVSLNSSFWNDTEGVSGYEIYSTIRGGSDAALRIWSNLDRGTLRSVVRILGNADDYYGLLRVSTNMTLRLCQNGMTNATVRLETATARLETYAPKETVVSVKSVQANETAAVIVTNANTLALGTLTFNTTLTKAGEGVLAVKASDAGENAAIAVTAGALRPLDSEAFRSIALTFGAGGSVVVDAGDAAAVAKGLLTAKTVTCEGATLPVRVIPVTKNNVRAAQTVGLLTVPEAQAEALAAKLKVRARGFNAGSIVISDADAEGLKTLSTTLTPAGFVTFIRGNCKTPLRHT